MLNAVCNRAFITEMVELLEEDVTPVEKYSSQDPG
jgi:hypothetical protein